MQFEIGVGANLKLHQSKNEITICTKDKIISAERLTKKLAFC